MMKITTCEKLSHDFFIKQIWNNERFIKPIKDNMISLPKTKIKLYLNDSCDK